MFLLSYPRGRVFGKLTFADIKRFFTTTYLFLPEGKSLNVVTSHNVWEVFGTDSIFARPNRKLLFVGFVARKMEMDICFGSAPSPLLLLLHVREPPEFVSLLCPWIVAIGLVVFYGMAGCLVLVVLVREILGKLLFFWGGQLDCCELERCLGNYPVGDSAFWTPPDYCDADDIALEMSNAPNIWTDGSREDFSSIGGFEVAGAGVYVLAPELAFEGAVLECGGGVW